MIVEAIGLLMQRENLRAAQMEQVMEEIALGQASSAQTGAFLAAMGTKGETVEELTGAARAMRQRSFHIQVNRPVFVDTCGTGGDGAGTFNISTASALVAAAAGVTVAKHGNRSVSSLCGSADVLAELGVNVGLSPERVEACVDEIGIGFLFAAKLHPAFAAIASVRKELGVRTFFNLLGPMANPANAQHQVLGVFAARWVPVVGEVLAALSAKHALVVHGDGLDEISVCGTTSVCEVKNGVCLSFDLTPEELGLSRHSLDSLRGADAVFNARVIRDILSGAKGGPRDAVLANAGAALFVAGAVGKLTEGVRAAATAIDSGAGEKTLKDLIRVSQEAAA